MFSIVVMPFILIGLFVLFLIGGFALSTGEKEVRKGCLILTVISITIVLILSIVIEQQSSESSLIKVLRGDYYLMSDPKTKVLTITNDGKHYLFSHSKIGNFQGSVDGYEYIYDLGISTDLHFDSLNMVFTLRQIDHENYKIFNPSSHVDFGDLKDGKYENSISLIKK